MGELSEFSAGLLNPLHPVPLLVKGQIERRYNVYRNNVTVGLMRALEANFPVVRNLLGAQYFGGFARDFAQIHPPKSPLMFQYGADFPNALRAAQDLTSYPYLGDIARLEILWRESYHAVDALPLSGERLASINPDILFDCTFIHHPALRLLHSHFAIHSIFAANTSGASAQVRDFTVAESVLITRPSYEVSVQPITADQFVFFSSLQEKENLGAALDRATTSNANFDLSKALALLLQSGAFQSIQIGHEDKR